MAPSLAYLLTQFAPAGDQVALFREDITAETFWLGVHVGSGRYVCMGLQTQTTSGKTMHQIVRLQMRQALQNVNRDDVGITVSGTWTSANSALVYNGNYKHAALTGRYLEYTTPAATTVGYRLLYNTNNGLAKITLDGSTTAANLCPTAQDVVDSGLYANTILVANGGTLNPTDRVHSQYAAVASGTYMLLASGLANTIHTIRIETTAYKPAASADTRVTVAGFSWLQGTQDLTATGIDLALDAEIGRAGGSVYDYAISCKPTGSGSSAFVGAGHGNDSQTDIDIALDGSPYTFSGNKVYTGGTSAAITRTSQLFHADVGAGATVVADVTSVFTAHKDNGLISNHTFDWQQSMDITTGYIAMFPTNHLLIDKANNTTGGASDETLTANDASVHANQQGQMLYAWDADGVYGVALYVPDLAVVNNYANDTNRYLWIEDGSGDNKIYLTRMQSGTVTAASQWGPGEVRYLAQRFAAADVALNQNAGGGATKHFMHYQRMRAA